jgi:hypothetical protein
MAWHERSIDFKNGLVDPTVLLEFMDRCYCGEVYHSSGPRHLNQQHHLYFPRPIFKDPQMDPVMKKLRNSRYNLVQMLTCQEDTYHRDVAEDVPLDQIDREAAGTFLEEADWLTDYAASSWMMANIRQVLESEMLEGSAVIARGGALLEVLEEMQAEDAVRVEQINVIDQAVVWGAMGRYLGQQPEPHMESLVATHNPTIIIPTQIYSERKLKTFAEAKFHKKLESLRYALRIALPDPTSLAA